jgi:hypothetical protein
MRLPGRASQWPGRQEERTQLQTRLPVAWVTPSAPIHPCSEPRAAERAPLDWGKTQTNLGFALARLGERESVTARLEEAVAANRAALEELTRERAPRTRTRLNVDRRCQRTRPVKAAFREGWPRENVGPLTSDLTGTHDDSNSSFRCGASATVVGV